LQLKGRRQSILVQQHKSERTTCHGILRATRIWPSTGSIKTFGSGTGQIKPYGDWQGGTIVDHIPLRFFEDLEEFDFNCAQISTSKKRPKELTSLSEDVEAAPFEVEMIVGKRELTPRAIESRVKWVGYPNKKDYTWEPVWRLKADVPKIVKSYERAQRDIRNKQML
jgi:hypothetical protein